MSKLVQTDWTAGNNGWLAAVTARAGKSSQDFFVVAEAAGIMSVSPNYIRDSIEEGRLHAANLNVGTNKMPFYRIARTDLIDFAKRISAGI